MNFQTQRNRWSGNNQYPHSLEMYEWGAEAGEPLYEQGFELESETEPEFVAGAVQAGTFDENQITNTIFFRRHPDHAGRPIDPAAEQPLATEWTDIRNRIVRPVLARNGITPIDLRPYKALIPLLNRYRGNIPLEYLLGWISVESGGDINSSTSLNEKGYFQLHPEESAALRIDHDRLATDPAYSVEKGLELVKLRLAGAEKLGFAPGTELHLTVGKLMHWLPKGVQLTIALMQKKGFHPTTWKEFRGFMLDNRMTILSQLGARAGTNWDPAAGVANVDTLLRRGRQITQGLGVQSGSGGSTPQVSPEFEAQFFY